MTRILDRASSFFASAFLVTLVLGAAMSTQDVWAAEPLLTACGFNENCTYEECNLNNWCFEPFECSCAYNPTNDDVCDCFQN